MFRLEYKRITRSKQLGGFVVSFWKKGKRLRLSPSSVGTYINCPYKYKLRYVDKIQSNIVVPHLEKGKQIHSEIERFYNTLPKEKKITPVVLENHKEVFDKETYKKYTEHFDGFVEMNKQILQNLPENMKDYIKPIAVEEKMYDENMDMVGIIDAVYCDEKSVLILDFKTGKPHKYLYPADRLQLAVYKHLWDHFHPDKIVTHWAHFYTKSPPGNRNPLIQEANKKDMDKMYKTFEDTRCNILAEIFPKATSNWFCGKCEYMERCYG